MSRDNTPLIYRSTFFYGLLMRVLHGSSYGDRYSAVAEFIPEGAEVLEVCAGDCELYRRQLRQKGVRFLGLDNSPYFAKAAERQGIPFRLFDLRESELPVSDYVVMHASLHLLAPIHVEITERLIKAARRRVIIAEPIRNMASSPNGLVAKITKFLTEPKGGGCDGFRFTEETMREHFQRFPEFIEERMSPDGRELIGVFRGQAPAE